MSTVLSVSVGAVYHKNVLIGNNTCLTNITKYNEIISVSYQIKYDYYNLF